MESLDARYFEADLCHAIECEKSEIDRQMAITERLTNELKANNKKSYLELENQTIVKAQEERQEQQLQEERERREAADAINRYETKIHTLTVIRVSTWAPRLFLGANYQLPRTAISAVPNF